jgi:hypothetical protein
MNHGFWRGLGGEGDTYLLHRGTLTLRVPASYHYTAVFQIGVNKILPNLNTLFGAPIWSFGLFKGLAARPINGSLGVKGIKVEGSGGNAKTCTLVFSTKPTHKFNMYICLS